VIDQQKVEKAIVSLILAIGEDPGREGLRDTPRRVSEMYAEIFSGEGVDPRDSMEAVFNVDNCADPVALKNIPFFSMCEHHMLPFFGVASIGYIPNGRVTGISKIARVLEIVSRRLQIQERLTAQIADAVYETVKPSGLSVIVEAEHLCMSMRGINKYGCKVITAATRGRFGGSTELRDQLVNLLKHTNP
jgi:GTP cyclohydrolase I